jgi:hypothetical protein
MKGREMSDDRGSQVTGTAANTNVPKVKWDAANMKSSYANVCNVTSTREEVVLLFGMHQAWQSGQKEVTVHLADRIILNPFAAKRLMALLNNVLREYEGRFGVLQVEGTDRETGRR